MQSHKRIIDTEYGTLTVFVIDIDITLTANTTVRLDITSDENIYPSMSAIVSTVSTVANTPLPNARPNTTNVGNAKFYLNSAKTNFYIENVNNIVMGGFYLENTMSYGLIIFRDLNGVCYGAINPLLAYPTDSARVVQGATNEYFGVIESSDRIVGTYPINASQTSLDFWTDFYNETSDPSTDPYDNIGTSGTGGGGGTGTAGVTSDDIGIPSLPTLEATDTGFITLYRPSVAELKALASYMWSSAFDIDTFKKLFADPMESILGLSKLGVGAPSGATQTVTVGNFSTGVSMTTLGNQYFDIDCGTLNVSEIKESYLSFAPYTKVSIYLPFIGVQQLNVDDFMSGSVSLTYRFDALSGSCLALITCAKSNKGVASLNSVMYSFMGQCSATVPVNGNDFANMISSAVTIGASIAGIAATGGAAAPLAVPAMASAAVNALKPTIEHSGSISGAGAILGVKTPYLIFERPRYCIPSNQNKYIGYPSFITENIGDLSGYTVFEDVKIVGNSHATTGEIEEIETIMKEGVYL